MAAFNYLALDANGREKKGVMEADTPKQVRQLLREKKLSPLEVTPIKEKDQRKGGGFSFGIGSALGGKDLALVTRQLATLLRASMPLEESLRVVGEQTDKPRVNSLLMAVRARVLEGMTLSSGMSDFPGSFSEQYRATIAAGEQSGHLDAVLERLADYTENQQRMRSKITQAAVYPILMSIVSILIVVFLLVFVVPKFVTVFTDTGQQLPGLTLGLLAVSDTLQTYGLYILFAMFLGMFMFRRAMRDNSFRSKVHAMLLKIPFVGYVIKTVNTARFARTFGTLTAAGEPAVSAMKLATEVITNLPIRVAVLAATDRVREGASIHLALKETGYFAPMSLHLIASGEASGQLDNMLERASDNQDREIEGLTETMMSLFEPFLILFMGGVILIIVLAILLPIFELNQAVG